MLKKELFLRVIILIFIVILASFVGCSDLKSKSDNGGGMNESESQIDGFNLRLETDGTEFDSKEKVKMMLFVENTNVDKKEVVYRSSKKYDFFIIDKHGDEIWRWSKDLLFTQMIQEVAIEKDEQVVFSEEWTVIDNNGLKVPSGSYQIKGVWEATVAEDDGAVTVEIEIVN